MADFMDKVLQGKVRTGFGTKKWADRAPAERKNINDGILSMARSDQKRELRFASKERFDQWKLALKGKAVDAYKDYHVEKLGDGSIIVYREMNSVEGYQPDGDKLVAVNGLSIHRSRAADRAGYSKWRVDNHMKGDSRRKWKQSAGAKPISAFSLIAKVLGGAGKGSKLGREAYTRASTGLWNAMKLPVLRQFMTADPRFQTAYATAEAADETTGAQGGVPHAVDRFVSRMTSSPRYKIAVLYLLATVDIGALQAWLTDGRGAVPELSLEHAREILEDPSTFFTQAVGVIVQKYPSITEESLAGAVGVDIQEGDGGEIFGPVDE